MKSTSLLVLLLFVAPLSMAKELYRSGVPGDSGTYYVLSRERIEGGLIKVLTSRVGKNNEYTDFTELNINCDSKQYFDLAGSSEDGAKESPTAELKDWSSNSKWVDLVAGSSKDDLVRFVCSKY